MQALRCKLRGIRRRATQCTRPAEAPATGFAVPRLGSAEETLHCRDVQRRGTVAATRPRIHFTVRPLSRQRVRVQHLLHQPQYYRAARSNRRLPFRFRNFFFGGERLARFIADIIGWPSSLARDEFKHKYSLYAILCPFP